MKSVSTITRVLQSVAFYFIVFAAVCLCPSTAVTSALSSEAADTTVYAYNDKQSEPVYDAADNATLIERLPPWFPNLLGLQFNGIYQNVPGFRSPYKADNSYSSDGVFGHTLTHIYGIYLGTQLSPRLQFYFDYEMAKGEGVSSGHGLGGYTNGDVIRVGGGDLGNGPYVARAYFRYIVPLADETEKVERAPDQLPGNEYVNRIEIKAGRMSPSDDFDLNRYANNTRTQFINYAFIYNPAWDEATDTRGYSYGVLAALVQPKWRLALGVYMVPTSANGYRMDTQLFQAQGSNLEFTCKPNDSGTVIRALAYLNRARMGNYNEAVAIANDTGSTPDVFADERRARTKYGFGINIEQPLADDGETGLFGRIGWNDGHNENFMYTEVDQHLSLGVQLSGIHWGRPEDRVGLASAIQGISRQHRDYLAAGGLGMLIGDGQLNYGPEQILEMYYRLQIGKYVQITPDYMLIANPGYNRDRGPASIMSMRMRVAY
ncbi:MAG: carbohydrate porin [Nitrospirae bacterium]|nr:carbohydrate porin [Nitrospirota bacterium]